MQENASRLDKGRTDGGMESFSWYLPVTVYRARVRWGRVSGAGHRFLSSAVGRLSMRLGGVGDLGWDGLEIGESTDDLTLDVVNALGGLGLGEKTDRGYRRGRAR